MNIPLLLETLRFLRPVQVLYRLKRNLHQPKLELKAAPNVTRCCKIKETIAKPQCSDGNGQFTFLNLTSTFQDWNQMEHGSLWTYNLNYMDWLEQEGMTTEDGAKWIDLFIHDLPANRTGQDPYPTALRIINWMKFFAKHPGLSECTEVELSLFASGASQQETGVPCTGKSSVGRCLCTVYLCRFLQ